MNEVEVQVIEDKILSVGNDKIERGVLEIQLKVTQRSLKKMLE